MKITIFRCKKDGKSETIQTIEKDALMDSVKKDQKGMVITKYREVFPYLDNPSGSNDYSQIPHLCVASEFYRNKAGERVFRAYNGVVMMKVENLCSLVEVEKVKRQASLMPQVYCAMVGADARSVIILTLANLPDGKLPQGEDEALLFATKAYMTSVQCFQPMTEYKVTIEQPALDTWCLMPLDENPFVNPYPTPFVIEQPNEASLKVLQEKTGEVKALSRMSPGSETLFTYAKVFNAAYHHALESTQLFFKGKPEAIIACTADICFDAGMPQEEVAVRLHHHFYKMDIDDVRAMVKNAYDTNDDAKGILPINKHQMVAYKMKEFLHRRYDIRYNEVMQRTEFRERHSFNFLYRELDDREQNTIFYEAQIEGIAPTLGEVKALLHSSLVPKYNPIMDWFDGLPAWDGRDRIAEVARMVPTDNPHWERLFKQWFLSMVAHWLNGDERHANSTAPILIGAQGYRKSTFCRLLLPPELQAFYTDSIDFRTNVEAERSLSRFLIINIDEFDQLTEKQFAFVKHLFQKPVTNIRRMFSETIGTQRRYASFIGTTNIDEVLRDPTGNRRYLCVRVTDRIHTEDTINYLQLYAQAVEMINSGVRYWIDDSDEALIRETNAQFQIHPPLQELFLKVFTPCSKEFEGVWLTGSEILERLMKLPAFNRQRDNNLSLLGKVLTSLCVAKRRRKAGVQYLVKSVS